MLRQIYYPKYYKKMLFGEVFYFCKFLFLKKIKINMKDKTVAITFMSDKNSVSNLLSVFKKLGYVATIQEVSCIGSKEGCLNAIHPESTMR